jgi:hypothetical protein
VTGTRLLAAILLGVAVVDGARSLGYSGAVARETYRCWLRMWQEIEQIAASVPIS